MNKLKNNPLKPFTKVFKIDEYIKKQLNIWENFLKLHVQTKEQLLTKDLTKVLVKLFLVKLHFE